MLFPQANWPNASLRAGQYHISACCALRIKNNVAKSGIYISLLREKTEFYMHNYANKDIKFLIFSRNFIISKAIVVDNRL
jgi:hypothetical protein